MKKYLLLFCCLLGTLLTMAQQGYTVKIKLNNSKNYKPYLAYTDNGNDVLQTDYKNENGWIVFRGKVSAPLVAYFGLRDNPALLITIEQGVIPGPSLNLFLTNQTITITGDADKVYMAKVEGGIANKEWSTVKPALNNLDDQNWEALKVAYKNVEATKDSSAFERLEELQNANTKKAEDIKRDFINKNPGSLVSVYFLSGLQSTTIDFDELKELYGKLSVTTKKHFYGKEIANRISSLEATSIGKYAIAINNKTDINGQPISLESLKGKYVLIDFWGSWCLPCRASHPHLKEMYKKYKDDGFEILGIAYEYGDTVEEARVTWKKTVANDGLGWPQILNNENVDQFDVVKSYGISAFPTKILVDKEGIIIARYIGESEGLEAKLKEIFGK